jgi:pimeloyl-ACP methyl ester carboxylesterase
VISQRRVQVGELATRCLGVDGPGSDHPVLFVHGVPTSADDWVPFLNLLDGKRRCLAPDQIGFGASDRVPGLTHTIDALADFIEGFMDADGAERFDIVTHDWGGTALIAAARRPERIGRVVVINDVPFSAGYRWHWVAQIWRRRPAGEIFNATANKLMIGLSMRQAVFAPGAAAELADQAWPYFNSGTKRAILELYRDADPEKLGEFGPALKKLTGPSLVIWGDRDPYLPPRFGDSYGEVLDAKVEHLPQVGHWPWLDRPELVGRVAEFLGGGVPATG